MRLQDAWVLTDYADVDMVLRDNRRFGNARRELAYIAAGIYEACDQQASRVSSLFPARYRTNDYSVPVAYGRREVLVKG